MGITGWVCDGAQGRRSYPRTAPDSDVKCGCLGKEHVHCKIRKFSPAILIHRVLYATVGQFHYSPSPRMYKKKHVHESACL